MKKFLFLLTAALMLLGTTACSDDDDNDIYYPSQMVSVATSANGQVCSVKDYSFNFNFVDATMQISGSVQLPDGSSASFSTPVLKMTKNGSLYTFSTSQVTASGATITNFSGTYDYDVNKFYITFRANDCSVWACNGLKYLYNTTVTTDTVADNTVTTNNSSNFTFIIDPSAKTGGLFIGHNDDNGNIYTLSYTCEKGLTVDMTSDGFILSADTLPVVASFNPTNETLYDVHVIISNNGRTMQLSYRVGSKKVTARGSMMTGIAY